MGWQLSSLDVLIACVPLAAYCLFLGAVQLRRRPFMTTGGRDLIALGLGVAGFVAVGPLALFTPVAAQYRFGPYLWGILLVLYFLGLAMVALSSRPRLVIYSTSLDQIRPLLADVVFRLDAEARWAGACVCLPNLGVQFHVATHPLCRTVELVGVGTRQNLDGWKRLERSIYPRLRQVGRTPSLVPWALLTASLLLFLAAVVSVLTNPQEVHDAVQQALRFSLPEDRTSAPEQTR
jgi:hypothetical protein